MSDCERRSDEELVAAVLAGDELLYAEIVGRYQGRLVNYLFRLLRNREDAHDMARQLGRREGILAGISTGASVSVGLALGKEAAAAGRDAVIICLGPDGGERYLSERFWEE